MMFQPLCSNEQPPLLAGTIFKHFSHLGKFLHDGSQHSMEDARNVHSQPPLQLEYRHGRWAPPIRLLLPNLRLGANGSKEGDVPGRIHPSGGKDSGFQKQQEQMVQITPDPWEGSVGSGTSIHWSSPRGVVQAQCELCAFFSAFPSLLLRLAEVDSLFATKITADPHPFPGPT